MSLRRCEYKRRNVVNIMAGDFVGDLNFLHRNYLHIN